MGCEEARKLLEPLVDGELGLERSLDVEAHVESCDSCASERTSLVAVRSTIRADLPYNTAPDSFKRRLRVATFGLPEPPAAGAPWPRSARIAVWAFAPVAAALMVFTFFVARLPSGNRSETADRLSDDALSGHLRSLMGNHLADIMSTDQHTVKPYFAGKLDFSPPVINLADHGFPLVAGRLDYMDGHPVAALVYRHSKHIINVFVWPSAGDPAAAPTSISRRGYQIVHWTAAGMTEWAVSDLNGAELRQFADYLRIQN